MVMAPQRRWLVAIVSVAVVVGPGAAGVAAVDAEQSWGTVTRRVSVGSDGLQANRFSYQAAVSADGRYVAFTSRALNLVPGDTNRRTDVFVRDRVAGVTRRVSVGPDGRQANDESSRPAISADGRYVAFESRASNLVPGDTSHAFDVFVRDRVAGVTRRISVGRDVRQANGKSGNPAISADGRYVAFHSDASNMVRGDTNRAFDVFVRDRVAGVTRRVSVGPSGRQANSLSMNPAISANGRYVAFHSGASNLVPGDDTNDANDIFVRDRVAKVTRRVSLGPGGLQANSASRSAAVSADGRYVVFRSYASNLVPDDTNDAYDIFVRDRMAGVTERVSVGLGGLQANNESLGVAISAHGRYVAFDSWASNLVPDDTNGDGDVFLRDRMAGVTERVSLGPRGRQANGYSTSPAITADGQHVAFISYASNLVPNDTNRTSDVFVRD